MWNKKGDISGCTVSILIFSFFLNHPYSLRPCPHVPKRFFSPTSFLTSFQKYLRPHGSTENDSKRCSSNFRPYRNGWNSPKPKRCNTCAFSQKSVFVWPATGTQFQKSAFSGSVCTVSQNDNNNNGRLHACVHAAEDIEPFLQLTHLVVECESQQQFDLIIGRHKRFWFPCTRRCRLLLLVFGFSVYCLFVYKVQAYCERSVCSSPPLVNLKCRL